MVFVLIVSHHVETLNQENEIFYYFERDEYLFTDECFHIPKQSTKCVFNFKIYEYFFTEYFFTDGCFHITKKTYFLEFPKRWILFHWDIESITRRFCLFRKRWIHFHGWMFPYHKNLSTKMCLISKDMNTYAFMIVSMFRNKKQDFRKHIETCSWLFHGWMFPSRNSKTLIS